jgi:hypothetical protein
MLAPQWPRITKYIDCRAGSGRYLQDSKSRISKGKIWSRWVIHVTKTRWTHNFDAAWNQERL